MLRVRIAPLPVGIHRETLRPDAADVDLDPDTFRDVELDVLLDLSERRVLASVTARATARLECDRTLDLYDQPVEGTHAVLFSADAPEVPSGDDDVRPLADDATHVDLTDAIRDTLVLALPLRRVSPAAEALDIPTAFGGPADDEPADDRWAALKALRDADPASTDSDD